MTDELSDQGYAQILHAATRAFYGMPDTASEEKVAHLSRLLADSIGPWELRRMLVDVFNLGIESTLGTMRAQYAPGFPSDDYVITSATYTEAGARQSVAENKARREHYKNPDVGEMALYCRLVSPWQRAPEDVV